MILFLYYFIWVLIKNFPTSDRGPLFLRGISFMCTCKHLQDRLGPTVTLSTLDSLSRRRPLVDVGPRVRGQRSQRGVKNQSLVRS